MSISDKLIEWYKINQRDLPWRHTSNPYYIWLSEVILQQTRIEQGLAYYKRFIQKFPTLKELADSTEEEILKLWQGLGYYTRARNLSLTAKNIVFNLEGVFPDSYSELKKLKGIGDYTAAAIASFAFSRPHAVIDGNVIRVVSRLFAIRESVDTTSGKNEIKRLATSILNYEKPGEHNQAMMELGALVCLPKSPLCSDCPVVSYCVAFKENRQHEFPVKLKKVKIRVRYFNYFFISDGRRFIVVKRSDNDVWRNLYEFPMIESNSLFSYRTVLDNHSVRKMFKFVSPKLADTRINKLHVLTHQKIYARLFWFIIKEEDMDNAAKSGFLITDTLTFQTYPVHRLMELFINDIGMNDTAV